MKQITIIATIILILLVGYIVYWEFVKEHQRVSTFIEKREKNLSPNESLLIPMVPGLRDIVSNETMKTDYTMIYHGKIKEIQNYSIKIEKYIPKGGPMFEPELKPEILEIFTDPDTKIYRIKEKLNEEIQTHSDKIIIPLQQFITISAKFSDLEVGQIVNVKAKKGKQFKAIEIIILD